MRVRWMMVALAALPTMAMAKTPDWQVSEASGAVTILHTGMSKVASRGLSVMPGDVVRTGPGGRAVLVRGREYMMVAPQSQLRLPGAEAKGAITQMVEEAGNVVFMIKKMAAPHFAVQTPYLAAVVKGTTFSISVDATGASVHVLEGAVDVATTDGGAHQMVLPGGSARVGAASLDTMRTLIGGRETILRSHAAGAAPTVPGTAPKLTVSDGAIGTTAAVAATVTEVPVSLHAITGGLVNDAPVLLADASGSLKQLATTQVAARDAQVTVHQAIVTEAAADAAAAAATAARADADARAAAAADAARLVAAQAAAKLASDQAAAQQAALAAAQQAQAAAQQAAATATAAQATVVASDTAGKAAADTAAQQASQSAATASSFLAQLLAAIAQATRQAEAAQAAQQAAAQVAAADQAASKLAAQQAAAAAATAAAAAATAAKTAPIAPGLANAGPVPTIIGAITGRGDDNGRGNGGVGNGIGIGNGKH